MSLALIVGLMFVAVGVAYFLFGKRGDVAVPPRAAEHYSVVVKDVDGTGQLLFLQF